MEESILYQFAEIQSKEKVQQFYDKTLFFITSTLTEMQKDKKITSLDYDTTRIFPMGDYTNDTFIDKEGELEIVIATSNPQIKIANKTYIKNLNEVKSKKKKQFVNNKGTFDEIIINFFNLIANHFDETTSLILTNEGVKILCLDEYGFKILIRFASYDEDDESAVLSFWDAVNKRIQKVNLFLYNDKILLKDNETKGNYKKLVRIFKNVRKTVLLNKWAVNSDLNKYFVELIAYNIPNSIMQDDDIKLVFIKALNYLENCNISAFKSFDGKSIQTFDLAYVSYSKIKNFIKYLTKIMY